MFLKRLCSSIVLLSLFCMIIINWKYNDVLFSLLSVLAICAAAGEICNMLENIDFHVDRKFVIPFAGIFVVLTNMILINGLNLFSLKLIIIYLLLLVLFAFIAVLYSVNDAEKLKKILNNVSVSLTVSFLSLFVIAIYYYDFNINSSMINYTFLLFILGTKSGDIGAYVTGTLTGRLLKGGNHKMIPSISPGKSYEGLAGGFVFTNIVVLAILFFAGSCCVSQRTFVFPFILSAALFFSGVAGDLAESSIKRTCKVKDSGNIIPGIGGVFDLLDSLFLSAPVFWILFLGLDILKSIKW